MTDIDHQVNPLFATRRKARTTVKAGGYFGLAMTAWLTTAVATGYGVSVADTGESSSAGSSSSSASSSSGSGSSSSTSGPSLTSSSDTSSATGSDTSSDTKSESNDTESGIDSDDTDATDATDATDSTADDTDSPAAESPGDDTTTEDDGEVEEIEGEQDAEEPAAANDDAPTAPRTISTKSESGSYSASIDTTATVREVASATGNTSSDDDTAAVPANESDAETPAPLVPTPVPTAQAPAVTSLAVTTARTSAAAPSAAPSIGGPFGFFNHLVTQLLDPFLADAPSTQDPVTPALWAVLAWVRRNVFNQAPTLNPTTDVQAGQTLTGSLGATDAEGDKIKYSLVKGPKFGTVTIDQATGTFTYVPDDINYDAAQTDSFTVTASDGRFNLLSLFSPHRDKAKVETTVLNPTVTRVLLDLPDGITNPNTPRYGQDGKTIYFAATPAEDGRDEIYRIMSDGTGFQCVTCGISPEITDDLRRISPFLDGSGKLMIKAGLGHVVYEDTPDGPILVPVLTPPAAARVIETQREMRISPDGKQVLFTQVQLGQGGLLTAVPIVGGLSRTVDAATGAPRYEILDARVVYPVGEGKQWTPDGKGIIVIGGQYEMGNVDDIIVDLATGNVKRLTANLDYDEDTDLSPNQKWIAIGSPRGYNALTPMTRIVRPAFLPALVQGAVYEAYAGAAYKNVTNQIWILAVDDELKRENGIPLFVEGDGFSARSMPSWNSTGDAIAFWEASEQGNRLVIANLNHTTSVGPVEGDGVTPHAAWAPKLSEYIPKPVALPDLGTHAGVGGGTATITEVEDPNNPAGTLRTVTYNNYVNELGMVLNGTEWTSYTASQNKIRYVADVAVTGANIGYLRGDVTIDKLARTIVPTTAGSQITSELDGDKQVLLDPANIEDARDNL